MLWQWQNRLKKLKRNFLCIGELPAFRNLPVTAPNTPGPGANHSSLLAPAWKQWGLWGVPGLGCSNAGWPTALQTSFLPVCSHEIWMEMRAEAQLQECFLAADSTPSYTGEPHTYADNSKIQQIIRFYMLKCLYQGIQIKFIFMPYLYQLC